MGTVGWGSERPFPALLIPRSPWLSPPSADGTADFSVTADTSVPQHRRVRCSQRALGAHTSGDGSVQPHTAGQRCVSRSPPTPGSAAIFSGRRRFSAQIPSRLKAAGQSSALCLQQTERTAETRRGGARGRRSCGRLTNKQPINRFETTVGGQIAVFSPERPTSGGVKEGDGAERRRRWVRAARGCDRGQLRSVGSENGPGWKGPVRTTEPFCQRCFFHPPHPTPKAQPRGALPALPERTAPRSPTAPPPPPPNLGGAHPQPRPPPGRCRPRPPSRSQQPLQTPTMKLAKFFRFRRHFRVDSEVRTEGGRGAGAGALQGAAPAPPNAPPPTPLPAWYGPARGGEVGVGGAARRSERRCWSGGGSGGGRGGRERTTAQPPPLRCERFAERGGGGRGGWGEKRLKTFISTKGGGVRGGAVTAGRGRAPRTRTDR